jgi:hypothetical protein
MTNNNNLPKWTQAIRQGDFAAAEAELTNAAATQVHFHNEMARIQSEAGEYGRYVALPVAERIQQEAQQGRITNPQQLLQSYERAVTEEVRNFRAQVRPGYMRSETEPYTPADQEVRDYVADRKQRQHELQEAGKRMSSLGPTR